MTPIDDLQRALRGRGYCSCAYTTAEGRMVLCMTEDLTTDHEHGDVKAYRVGYEQGRVDSNARFASLVSEHGQKALIGIIVALTR